MQIYWSNRDVITWLAENSDDEHLKKVKQNAEQHALKMEVASRSVHDEKALFDEDDGDDEVVLGRDNNQSADMSKQRALSVAKVQPQFEGLRITTSGHKVQDIRELMTVPVSPDVFLCIVSYHSIGHRHCRSDQEPACYQGLQRQSLR